MPQMFKKGCDPILIPDSEVATLINRGWSLTNPKSTKPKEVKKDGRTSR